MAKPGIFTNKFGFAGYPLQRRFKDSVYAPVWQRIGKWRQYSKKDGEIKSIPTIALDKRVTFIQGTASITISINQEKVLQEH